MRGLAAMGRDGRREFATRTAREEQKKRQKRNGKRTGLKTRRYRRGDDLD
jgi:hypothetical protein